MPEPDLIQKGPYDGIKCPTCGAPYDELHRLREEARRFYLADGTFILLDTPEQVVEARIAAAKHFVRSHREEADAPRPDLDPEDAPARGPIRLAELRALPRAEQARITRERGVIFTIAELLADGAERAAEVERMRAAREDLASTPSTAAIAEHLAQIDDTP